MAMGAKCCDAMIYYCKELGKALLVLIELKGSDHDAAVEQLLSVYDKLRQERDWIKPHCYALSMSSTSAPPWSRRSKRGGS